MMPDSSSTIEAATTYPVSFRFVWSSSASPGRDDRLAQIKERLIEVAARSDADNVVLQVIVGQLAAARPDWRDYLDTLRMIAEAGIREHDLPHQPV
jgi:hypothetical protein